MITDQDHAEALRINEIFDEKAVANASDIALAAAIEQVDTEFGAEYHLDKPGTELYGYSVAKNALRWWTYGTAYLKDLEDAGPNEEVSKDQIELYGKQKNYAGDKLHALDPVYFKTFDLLERERIRRSLKGQPEVNPFELARDYAALVLSSAIDMKFGVLEAGPRHFDLQGIESTYRVERTPDTRATSYIISEYAEARPGYSEPKAVYIIDGPRDPIGHPFVMQTKGGQPVVEACQSLDLADAVTGYNESLENAAFERVAMILAARRDAESEN